MKGVKPRVERGELDYCSPIPLTYVSVFKLLSPCLGLDPGGVKSSVVKIYSFSSGGAYVAYGDSREVVESAYSFKLVFDRDAPVSFLRDGVRRALAYARGSLRSLLLIAYLPTRSSVRFNSKCSPAQQRAPGGVLRIPPLADIDKCTPKSIGEALIHESKGLGLIATAVTPVYTYVVAGYRLVLAGPPVEEVAVGEVEGGRSG